MLDFLYTLLGTIQQSDILGISQCLSPQAVQADSLGGTPGLNQSLAIGAKTEPLELSLFAVTGGNCGAKILYSYCYKSSSDLSVTGLHQCCYECMKTAMLVL